MQINRQGAKKRRNENEVIVSLIFESRFKIGIISIDTQLITQSTLDGIVWVELFSQ
jgi:hypothetical protein